jgi:hypothetical protein
MMLTTNTLSDIQVDRRVGQVGLLLQFDTIQDRKTIEKRITEYLTTLDFQLIVKLNRTYFKRGSAWALLYSTSPRAVPTVVDITYDPDFNGQALVIAEMIVQTTGGMATQKDIDCWMVEMAGIEQSVLGENVDFRLSQYAADRAKWHSCALVMGIIVFCFLAVGILALLVLLSPTPAHCGC